MIEDQDCCHKEEDLNGCCKLDDRRVQGRAFKLHAILNKCGLLLNTDLQQAFDLDHHTSTGDFASLHCMFTMKAAAVPPQRQQQQLPEKNAIKQHSICYSY